MCGCGLDSMGVAWVIWSGLLDSVGCQRRCDIRHELLTHRALFCIGKMGMLSQHFVMHVIACGVWLVGLC